jgi:O-acetyl-ADP-ribose deacetylase (regulator of RNase III)
VRPSAAPRVDLRWIKEGGPVCGDHVYVADRARKAESIQMIHQVSGDILLSQCQVIAHGVAPNDNFNHGLAHSLREAWPAMYKDFRHYCHTTHPKTGELWAWMGADGRRVVALFTQEEEGHGGHPGKASTSHVAHALKALRKLAVAEKFTSIALPRLATGVGGLQWHDVEPLVREQLGDLGIPVYVYTTYRRGEQARELASAA